MKRTVISMLQTAARDYSSSVYTGEKLENGWSTKTFAEINLESNHIAAYLIDKKIERGNNIAILSEGRTCWITAEYGIIKSGATAVPLSIKLIPEELLFRLNHSKAKGIFISRNSFDKIVPVLDKIEQNDFKIYYFDDNFDKLSEEAQELSKSAQNLINISTVISEGKLLYEKNNAKGVEERIASIKEDDVVTISYTSGTTGNPKGIMLTHLNYYTNSNSAMAFFNLPNGFRTLLILPLDHSFAHTVGIYISLLRGISIYFVDARGGNMNVLKNIPINLKEVAPDFLLTVPALTSNFMRKIKEGVKQKGKFANWLFNKGLKAGIKINGNGHTKAGFLAKFAHIIPYKLADAIIFKKVKSIFGENIQFCVGGGALLDINQQKFFYTIGGPVYQGYGLTEATPIISSNTYNIHKLGTSGHILPGIKCKIVDPDRVELPMGKKGEIAILADSVMKGYYKNKKASAEVLDSGWLYTGDMGYIEEDNFLMVVGREKALLISEDGEKYSPEGIESAIEICSELIAQVVVYNDHKKFTTAIATLDIPKLKSFAKEHNISDAKELMQEVKRSFYNFKEEPQYSGQFPEKWMPSVLRLVEEPFSEENKMINSTMKKVRYKIVETYSKEIAEMYENAKVETVCPKNEEVLRKVLSFN